MCMEHTAPVQLPLQKVDKQVKMGREKSPASTSWFEGIRPSFKLSAINRRLIPPLCSFDSLELESPWSDTGGSDEPATSTNHLARSSDDFSCSANHSANGAQRLVVFATFCPSS